MKLDVRTKVLLVCFANLTFLFRVTGWVELVTVGVLAGLLFLAGRRRMALYQLGFFLVCLLVELAFFEVLLQLPIQLQEHFFTSDPPHDALYLSWESALVHFDSLPAHAGLAQVALARKLAFDPGSHAALFTLHSRGC